MARQFSHRPQGSGVGPPVPSGPTQFATVYERHTGHSGPVSSSVETDRAQQASDTPGGAAVTSLDEHLRVGVLGFTEYSNEPVCPK